MRASTSSLPLRTHRHQGLHTTYDSNESLYAKLKSGGVSYDVIFPSDYMVGKMINEGMLSELDMDNIPNIAGVAKPISTAALTPGNKYSVRMWGTTGLIYNTTMVEEPPTKWADMWDGGTPTMC